MLSILIPIYNFDIQVLVQDLQQQCLEARIPFEIICLDDGSTISFKKNNQSVKTLEGVIYQELPQNLGRSKIRNRLAERAQYPYLLYMDCDSKVVRQDYIQSYINQLAPNQLLYGGRVYNQHPPERTDLLFHWYYGRQREQQTFEQRKKQPYHSFMTNNFLIPKAIFASIQFDEQLTQYGHEDTLFGMELKNRNIPIIHLDNPLEHLGLETQVVFLQKTQKAIENLYLLHQQGHAIETKLLSLFQTIERYHLKGWARGSLRLLAPFIKSRLSKHPKQLVWFDLYKLLYLLDLS